MKSICARHPGVPAFVAGCLLALAACSNGDDHRDTPSAENTAPVAHAGADRAVHTGDTVALAGSGTDADGDVLTYAWTAPVGGPALDHPAQAAASFVAPVVVSATALTYHLTVTDSHAASGGDDVVITVLPPEVPPVAGRVVNICGTSEEVQTQALKAFFDAREGDTLQFCEGRFSFTSGLVMTGKRGITIKGAGMNKTYLRFADSTDQDGISINRVTGIKVQDLTIYDAPGNGFRLFRTDDVIIRGVKVGWSLSDPPERGNPFGTYDEPDLVTGAPPATWTRNGSYAFYPVLCHRVLIEDSISVGSSDAGVYVGQSSDILVRRTEAYHNVAGFEFENTYRAEFVDNIAHDNVGGFLVFDLPGRGQYGEKNLVHDNRSYDNNLPSFAPRGAIVGYVPAGIGMLVLASDQLEVYRNVIENNHTAGLAIVNYGLVSTTEGDRKYDFFPEGMHVYANTFTDNGAQPQLPNLSRDNCLGDPNYPGPLAGAPGQADLPHSTNDLNSTPPPPGDCLTDNASLLPAILVLKNAGTSAQIVWDGGVDPGVDGYCVPAPTDRTGAALANGQPKEAGRYEQRADERGRPNYYIFDPPPSCTVPAGQTSDGQHHTYNAWKFDGAGKLKKPENGICIHDNTFGSMLPFNPVSNYANVHFSTADPTAEQNQTPADNEVPDNATNCPTLSLERLEETVPVLPTFAPNPVNDPAPTGEEIAAACDGGDPDSINYDALLNYNCPRLDQYRLFDVAGDPRTQPRGFSVPFDLNTILFSDYAVKYRFLFLPPDPEDNGQPLKARYVDRTNCHEPGVDVPQIFDCTTAALQFPTGTVFAKTFAFRKDGPPLTEDVVETRLLIKRPGKSGGEPRWVGMAYLWGTAGCPSGVDRCALLKIEGATKAVQWDYLDENPDARSGGVRPKYTGSTENYGIPNAGACLVCHSADDKEPGAAPIGPKVRNLNKSYDYGDGAGPVGQLQHWQSLGFIDLPDAIEQPLPKWNVPGSGDAANAALDTHRRARAYLEVNCMHCHNSAGYAQNSGLGLDATDALYGGLMGEGHGICKPPIAAGKAADRAHYDIAPGDTGQSLLFLRVSATEAGIKMPPLARTVAHAEAVSLLGGWITDIVATYADADANTCSSDGGTPLPADMGVPVPPSP